MGPCGRGHPLAAARASRTARPAPRASPASGSDATTPGVAPTEKGRCGPGRENCQEDGSAIPPLLSLLQEAPAKPAAEALEVVAQKSRILPLGEHAGSSAVVSGKVHFLSSGDLCRPEAVSCPHIPPGSSAFCPPVGETGKQALTREVGLLGHCSARGHAQDLPAGGGKALTDLAPKWNCGNSF